MAQSAKVYKVGDLFQSATYGDLDTLIRAIDSGISVESVTVGGSSVLHFAAYGGQTKIVFHLIEKCPECIPKGRGHDMQGYNALHNCCAFSGSIGVYKLLEKAGFDQMDKTADGLTALELAEEFDKQELVEYIQNHGNEDLVGDAELTMEDLGLSDQQDNAELSLTTTDTKMADVTTTRSYTIVDLFTSAEEGDMEKLDAIVSSGIPVDSTTRRGSSVLHFAACNGKSEMVNHLVKNHPTCHVKGQGFDHAGFNALHHAARSGKVEIFQELICEAGFDKLWEIKTADGRSVLDLAGEAKQTDMIQYLSRVKSSGTIDCESLKDSGLGESFTHVYNENNENKMDKSQVGPKENTSENLMTEPEVKKAQKSEDQIDAFEVGAQSEESSPKTDVATFSADKYDNVMHDSPEDTHRKWISLHRSASEGNTNDVLRLMENGADAMKKISSAFFQNLKLERKQMLTPLEVAFFSKKCEMVTLLVRYTGNDIVQKCLDLSVHEYSGLKPYIVKGILEKKYKGKFIEVVFGELKPKKQKMFAIYTETIAHGSETSEAGYPVQFRNPSVCSDEGRKALYNCQQHNYKLSEKEGILVTNAVKQYSDKLWKEHSNIRGIMSSPVKSSRGKFLKKTCLLILCHFKGFVPDKEPVFPEEVKVGDDILPVDVREGHFMLHYVQCPDALHAPLSFGCNIGTTDDPSFRYGSIGPFVQLADDSIGFITCAHVVNGSVTYVDSGVPDIYILQPGSGTTMHPEDDRMCGKVVYLRYSLDEDTSIDVAVVKITDPERVPQSPGFAAYNQKELKGIGTPVFDHGKYGEPTAGKDIIKFGSASGVTYGTYRGTGTFEFSSKLYGTTSNINRWKGVYFIDSRQCSERGCFASPFSSPGDSGAGVFQIRDDNSLVCVGILVGAEVATGSGIVIPIQPILEASGVNLKVFSPQS
ncbi:uncharacterized protein [Argopecten irradians]|uniref:uncharacterized protein isoform X2 n=1 Tax=Argopecten irradians TaxID=31199 RepID=UPI0037218666